MSSPAFGTSGPDRIGRTARFAGSLGGGDPRPRSKALRRVFDIATSVSILMLVMLAGLGLGAVLSLTQGMH